MAMFLPLGEYLMLLLENFISVTLFFCRYSYFHKLLPLLMTGLSDEMPDIQKQARQLMDKVIKNASCYVTSISH